jgi:hypothetical protein
MDMPMVRAHLDVKASSTKLLRLRSFDRRERLGITIGFSTTNKLISRFIRWITGAKVSHAWIGFNDDTLGQRMVMQAERWGYEIRPWARWLTQNTWMAEFELSQEPATASLQFIATFLGSDYDFKSAILLGLKRWFRRWFKSPTQSPTKIMCSEGVIRFLQYSQYEFAAKLDPESTSPGELLSVVTKSLTELTNPAATGS